MLQLELFKDLLQLVFLNFKIYNKANKPCFHQLCGITNADFDFQKGYIEIGKVTKFWVFGGHFAS